MAFFLGNYGSVAIKRSTGRTSTSLSASIGPDDISTSLNRVGFDRANLNFITGDRLELSTSDTRKLEFIPTSNWPSAKLEDSFSCFVNVNEAGGLRLFTSFSAAVNNSRSEEISLQAFTGNAIEVKAELISAFSSNPLGNVASYEFNTTRDAIDVTSLSDYFKTQYNAGLLSGSGRLECLFDYSTNGRVEPPLAVMQMIQRLDLGCAFDALLYLSDEEVDPNLSTVFYQITAVITQVGITVNSNSTINATIDFVTTGELRLLFGRPSEYILKEDNDRIELEDSVDFLLKEVAD